MGSYPGHAQRTKGVGKTVLHSGACKYCSWHHWLAKILGDIWGRLWLCGPPPARIQGREPAFQGWTPGARPRGVLAPASLPAEVEPVLRATCVCVLPVTPRESISCSQSGHRPVCLKTEECTKKRGESEIAHKCWPVYPGLPPSIGCWLIKPWVILQTARHLWQTGTHVSRMTPGPRIFRLQNSQNRNVATGAFYQQEVLQ